MKGCLTEREIALGRECLQMALDAGASKARVLLGKSLMDLVATLDGEVDRVSHCLDRSLVLTVFAEGRYGVFSTNRIERRSLRQFAARAVHTTRMLAPDPCRDLPPQERVEKGAITGLELDLYDPGYRRMTPELRRRIALGATLGEQNGLSCSRGPEITSLGEQNAPSCSRDPVLLSEEGEYSDSVSDSLLLDSEGTCCRQIETSFEYGVEVTVADASGRRYSSYWWDAAPRRKDLHEKVCARTAFERACSQIGPVPQRSCRCNMVIDREIASRILTPVLNALSGSAVQQHNSFLEGKVGEKVFGEALTVIDDCRTPGRNGSRLFDSEGVATTTHPVIEKGVVKEYFLNTYMAAKTGLEPTVDDCSRPVIPGWPRKGLSRDDLVDLSGEGILVTGLNGGNSNPVTGDFSYGIEGFAFKDGRITHPVSEMLMTGNLITLWQNLTAVAEDARACMSRPIGSLAFKDVDFSG